MANDLGEGALDGSDQRRRAADDSFRPSRTRLDSTNRGHGEGRGGGSHLPLSRRGALHVAIGDGSEGRDDGGGVPKTKGSVKLLVRAAE